MMDLAIVARTCVAFHSPALDYLWRSATLINLLRCLPSDLVVVEELAVRSGRPQYTMVNAKIRIKPALTLRSEYFGQ